MVYVPSRNLQAVNIFFSSWAIILLAIGVIIEDWVVLVVTVQTNITIHSPWNPCCPTFWPEESLRTVRGMLMLTLNLSVCLNLILGLQFTYMISQNKCAHLFITFLSFFTGCILLYALIVYNYKLKEGQLMYFSSFKIRWTTYNAYLAIVLFIACGVICLIQCTDKCACVQICLSDEDLSGSKIPGHTIKAITEHTAMPRSIVHVHSLNSDGECLSKSHIQKRRVTWAV
uniref:Transmembrane protein 225 n=1 Tax=Jaculus jaculus TaxID=51337 RepID=A0A8C5K0Y9_JACJA